MAVLVEMPRYGANMEEGTVGQWHVSEGDEVKKGQIICEIEIEKLTNEFEAPEDGVLRKVLCPEGETRACGEPIAVIAGADEDISALVSGGAVEEAGDSGAADAAPAAAKPVPTPSVPKGTPGKGMAITPKALKLAEELGVDYSGITGTGIHGAITRQDIRNAASAGTARPQAAALPASAAVSAAPVPPAGGWKGVPASGARKITARRMMESLSSTAQATIVLDADLTELAARYPEMKKELAKRKVKLSYTALIVKALAAALKAHPNIRTVMNPDLTVNTLDSIDIGVGVDAEYGLIVPVVRDADGKNLAAVCVELLRLSDRARAGSLSTDEMGGAAITLSNLGMFGVRYSTPILNTGESAIIGAGTMTEEPVIRDGGLHFRNIMAFSMTFDHRIIDGAPAARFMQDVVRALQDIENIYR